MGSSWSIPAVDNPGCLVWDAETGELLMTLSGHTAWTFNAIFNPAGDQILTSSIDGSTIVWDFLPKREACPDENHLAEKAYPMAFAARQPSAPMVCGSPPEKEMKEQSVSGTHSPAPACAHSKITSRIRGHDRRISSRWTYAHGGGFGRVYFCVGLGQRAAHCAAGKHTRA
jgi:WD40 repeat protein